MRKRKRGVSLPQVVIILGLVGLLTACAGLQFKLKTENKLAIAKEGGYQVMFRLLKEMPEGEAKEKLKANSELEFTAIREELDNEGLAIDAAYLKAKLYTWIEKGLTELKTSKLSEEDKRLILKTQDFFALEGGYEATPDQRILGMAFCDGVLEAVGKL